MRKEVQEVSSKMEIGGVRVSRNNYHREENDEKDP